MTKPWGYWKAKTSNPWLKRVWRRLHSYNQNYLCIVYGPPGTGKSTMALKLGELLDPTFDIDHVVFSVAQFFRLITSGKLKAGSVVVFEELGVAANAREWHTEDNILLSKITQVFRTRNLAVFYTVPQLEFADRQISRITTALIETQGVHHEKELTEARVYDPVRYDPKRNQWIKHLISISSKNPLSKKFMRRYKVSRVMVAKPSVQLTHQYLEARNNFSNALGVEGDRVLTEQSKRAKGAITPELLNEIADKVVSHREDFVSDRAFDLIKLQNRFGLGMGSCKRVKSLVKEKLLAGGFGVLWR